MCDWVRKQLGDVLSLQRGHDLPAQDRVDGSVPIMGSAGITGWHNEVKKTGPGVVVGRSGNSMGKVSFSEENYWPLNTCLYVTDFKGNHERFIYYLLQTINFDQFNSGSAQKSLNRNAIYPFEVLLPEDTDAQEKIAKILCSLESKIALNQSTNQTLEQIAQAIFKSWFVDFEPVKAKQHIRALGGNDEQAERAAQAVIAGAVNLDVITTATELSVLDQRLVGALSEKLAHQTDVQREQLAATASYFPDQLVESELGGIPEGWDPVTRVISFFEFAYGKALKKVDRAPGPYLVYGSGGVTGKHDKFLVEGPGVIVGRKGTVGSLYWEDEPFFPIDTVFYAKAANGVPLTYIFYLLQTLGLDDMNTDAAVPGLNRNNVYRLEVPNVPEPLMTLFAKHAEGFRNQMKSLNAQVDTLKLLRDSLLPKLLSGELTVNEAA